jgi:glycosyltransferase involved in cell wall biosynthesis
MKIGIDARELSGKPTGVGRYLGGLVREWTAPNASHGHEILLYSHQSIEPVHARSPVRIVPGSGGTVWEQRDLRSAIASDRIDVLFSPAYSTPLFSTVPRVVALHDISFVARPEWFRWREGVRRRVLARRSASAARAVVTISEFSKREVIERLGTAGSRVHVIPPGIDRPCGGTGIDATRTGANVLFVGSVFNRRHVPELIAAFERVADRHADAALQIVGDNRTHPRVDVAALVAGSRWRERIHWHQYLTESRLGELYADARAFAFLSEYEGLGLTPLEALACGIPSLLLDTAVARESCGSAAAYVSLDPIARIATELERLLYEADHRAALLSHAPATLSRYSWTMAASKTMRVLEDAV